MRIEGLDHPKTLDLAASLGIALPTAIGHLELLWAFTAKKAPQGNIGKWPDGAIARWCHWMGDPHVFLQSLLQCRLIDAHPDHRYVIHDWYDHAPRWVRAKLSKARLDFIGSVERSAVAPVVGSSDEDDDDHPPDDDTVVGSTVRTASPTSKARQGKGREGKGSTSQSSGERENDQPGEMTGTNREETEQLQAEMRACGALSIELRKLGVNVTSQHPLLVAWVREFTLLQCQQAAAVARASLGEDVSIAAKYLDKCLRSPPKASAPPPAAADSRRRLTPIEIIEAAILEGRTDEEIVAMPELELVPTVRADIALMRQEISGHAQH